MKKASDVFRTILIVILLGIIAFSGYNIFKIMMNYHTVTVSNDEVRDTYRKMSSEKEGLPEIDFEGLRAMNPDIVAWIYIPDTNVDFPVLMGAENSSYLYTNYKREYSFAGSIFMDVSCDPDFTDQETMIYGHNMHNGDMFGRLKKFQDESYLDAHSKVYILLPGGEHIEYTAREGIYISVNDDIYNLPKNDGDPETMILSTCTDDSSDTERFVLICDYEERIKD